MKSFTVYSLTSGEILRTGYCQDETFSMQPRTGVEGVIEGQGDPRTQRVDPDTQQLVQLQ